MNFAKNNNELQEVISAARGQFDELLNFVTHPSPSRPLHEVERGIFQQLLLLGLSLLQIFLATIGTGDVGSVHKDRKGVLRRNKGLRTVMYRSIFGNVKINRSRYWERGAGSVYPLDATLNLPKNCYSYLLQEWGMLIGVQSAWSKVTDFLQEMLQIDLWNSSCERIAADTAKDVKQFYTEQGPPEPTEEGKVMAVTLDCKGVPIKKEEPNKKAVRLKKGEKPGRKKMSTVTVAYTIDRYERSVDVTSQKVMAQNDFEVSARCRERLNFDDPP